MRYLLLFFLFVPMAYAQAPSAPSLCAMIKDKSGVDYVPGIDVKGKAVVSADLRNDFVKSLYPVEIPIEVDLIDRFDLNIANDLGLEPVVAHLQVHEDGRVMYGEQDLTGKAQELCQWPTKNKESPNYNE